MGKVHRIKKHFWRIVSEDPLPVGNHYLAKTSAHMYIGKRRNSSFFVMPLSSHYKKLLNQLIKDYHAGVGHADKNPVKD